jgi:inhibitor of cysteine peptidase
MENNNTFKTLAYVLLGIVVVIVAIVLLTKNKKSNDKNMIIGTAQIESIEVSKTDTFPVAVNILAKGYLEDGCATLGDTKQTYENSTFTVTLESKRPQNAKVCTQVIQNFEENISLTGVSGLPKGTYTVEVNGVKGAFTLGVDNFISETDPLK